MKEGPVFNNPILESFDVVVDIFEFIDKGSVIDYYSLDEILFELRQCDFKLLNESISMLYQFIPDLPFYLFLELFSLIQLFSYLLGLAEHL